jgi:formylglycine-generating enzyme required for sulfatase activity/dienelactone hydrolase/tRNA A-37 threonylcarbamoyl transferase component Bud32
MSGKPGESDAPAEPPPDEPGATFIRPPTEERTQDLLRSPSLETSGAADPDLPRLRPEELLAGRFSIIRFIARGGKGAVYEAEDLSLRTRVALKIIRSALLAETSALERFRREVLLARRVGHPNVCHVYEFYDARTAEGVAVHFLTMELLDGQTLAHRLRERGRMSTAEALPLVLQMCDGLAAAHAEGVIHRDFKSSNVLLVQKRGPPGDSGSTRAVITDFGIARPLESGGEAGLTAGAGMIGTPEYMAPEQVIGGAVTPSTDLFALGVVMYEMVTGELPFTGETPLAIAAKRIQEAPRPPETLMPGLDRRWSGIILRCLAREPERRFRSAEELRAALLAPPRHPVRRAGLVAAGVLGFAALALAASLYLRREARVRWARDVALPKLVELADLNKYPEATALAEQIQGILPDEPRLRKLLPEVSRLITVETTPSGATVEVKPYAAPETAWRNLGVSPVRPVRLPIGLHLWRITLSGYEPVTLAAPSQYAPPETRIIAALDRVGSIPAEMVHVPGGGVRLGFPQLDHLNEVVLGEYLVDRTEVTNRQFKRFVDEGGYRRRELWKEPFVRAGTTLSWEQAMALLHDRTGRPAPATWELGDYPEGQGEHPVTGVSWYEAAAYAAFVGKALPNMYQWSRAAGTYLTHYIVPVSNFRNAGTVAVATVGAIGPYGTHDMAGNAKEWCRNPLKDGRRFVLGGGWNEPSYMFNDADAQDPFTRGPSYGFRLVKPLDDRTSAEASGVIPLAERDYTKETPVPPEIGRAYLRLYAYDRGPLEARTEEMDDTSDRWRKEKVSFTAAYGRERVSAYLLTPRSGQPPYPVVVFFPGSNAIQQRSSKDLPGMRLLAPILRSGRAVLYPIYKSTFERGDGLGSDYQAPTTFYRDHVIMWAKDLGRSIDWIDTRPDLDPKRVAYYGASWGAFLGGVMLAVEERIKVGLLVGGGLEAQGCLPEADPFNFLGLVRQPVLMVNGRYDFYFPVEQTQVPMFKLLGTQAKDKRHLVLEAGHVPPNDVLTQEVLDWLDRYLGPAGG